jgi:sporulation protein YlmC with PRC-barrel domain
VQRLDIETALEWRGRTVVDRDGEKIGTLKEIYLDEAELPSWGSIHTGLFGLRQTLAPLTDAQPVGDELRVPYERERVKDAPNLDPDVQLTVDEEQRLYRHYGLAAASDEQSEPADTASQPGGDAMTRSEEEVRIGKRTRVRGRARLKKYVVTDYVEKKVPVKREEVRVEHEPPDTGDQQG